MRRRRWIKPVILLSIPWAISIHTVTAFIYSGLAARPFWMTAILAPRFLASAFAAGPGAADPVLPDPAGASPASTPAEEAIQKLAMIVTYAMLANVFFVLMEFFTAFYSAIPEHIDHFQYLYCRAGRAQRAGALDVDLGRSGPVRAGAAAVMPGCAPARDAADVGLRRGGRLDLDREGPGHGRHRLRPLAAGQGHAPTARPFPRC